MQTTAWWCAPALGLLICCGSALGQVSVTLTQPNGGESISTGIFTFIRWDYTGEYGLTANIYLYRGGSLHSQLGSRELGKGHLFWSVDPLLTPGDDYRIKVEVPLEGGGVAEDFSDSYFSIVTAPVTLELTSPNGGETLIAGSTATVTWTSSGIETVYLYLYKAGLYQTYIGTAPGVDGSLAWDLDPNLITGSDYTVEVYGCSPSGTCLTDLSDASFQITGLTPALTLVAPNGGEQLAAGSTVSVTWSSAALSWVDAYLYKGGYYWGYIGGASAGAGSVSWTIALGAPSASDYTVKLVGYPAGGGTVEDFSDAPFTIVSTQPTVTLIAPNGGESIQSGGTFNVLWAETVSADVTASFYLYKGGYYHSMIGQADVHSHQFSWSVDSSLPYGTDYLLRIAVAPGDGTQIDDYSDWNFTIESSTPAALSVTYPQGGETLAAGSAVDVSWTSSGAQGLTAYVHLYKGGQWYKHLGTVAATANGYTWNISPSIGDGTDYTINVTACRPDGTHCIHDWSDGAFSITGSLPPPSLVVTSPNGGETWQAGSTQAITWTAENITGTLDVYYGHQGGTEWYWIGSAPASTGRLDWHICPQFPDGSDYKIRVWWWDGEDDLYDDTDGTLTIAEGQGPPALLTPNGGEVLQAGVETLVTWTPFDGMASLELYRGTEMVEIMNHIPGEAGSYRWVVCSMVGDGSDYTLRLTGMVCGDFFADASDAPFTIQGSVPMPTLRVVSPNGGESWKAGTRQAIRWHTTAASGDVDITFAREGEWQRSYLASAPVSAGEVSWDICPSLGDGEYKIYVEWNGCVRVSDGSDASFSITDTVVPAYLEVTSPAGGESFQADSAQTITWSGGNPGSTVQASLWKGSEWKGIIGSAPAEQGSMPWRVCGLVPDGADYTVQISSPGCGTGMNDSSAAFAVTGGNGQASLQVLSPNGGEVLQAGSTHTITWAAQGLTDTVSIYCQADGFYQHVGEAPAAAGALTWDLCENMPTGSGYKIMISGATCSGSVSDTSDGSFAVSGGVAVAQPELALTYPVGGELWKPGSTKIVTWSAANAYGDVRISLSRSNQQGRSIEVTAPMSAGSAALVLPADLPPAADYRISLEGSHCFDEQWIRSNLLFIVPGSAQPGDLDGDGDVDVDDASAFLTCAAGPEVALTSPDCGGADLDGDGDADQQDFARYQRCYSGPNRPARSDCLD